MMIKAEKSMSYKKRWKLKTVVTIIIRRRTRVGLDFVTIQNRIMKLNLVVVEQQNRVTPSPFDF